MMEDKGGSIARTSKMRNKQRSADENETEPNKDLDNIKLTDESDHSATDPDEPLLIGELTEKEKSEILANAKFHDMYREHFFAHQEDDESKSAKTDNLNRYLAIRKLLNNLENFNKSRSPE